MPGFERFRQPQPSLSHLSGQTKMVFPMSIIIRLMPIIPKVNLSEVDNLENADRSGVDNLSRYIAVGSHPRGEIIIIGRARESKRAGGRLLPLLPSNSHSHQKLQITIENSPSSQILPVPLHPKENRNHLVANHLNVEICWESCRGRAGEATYTSGGRNRGQLLL